MRRLRRRLDASFSFDGAIDAFAITNDIVLMALGPGNGAMYVRSLTVCLVRQGTLGRYVCLWSTAPTTPSAPRR